MSTPVHADGHTGRQDALQILIHASGCVGRVEVLPEGLDLHGALGQALGRLFAALADKKAIEATATGSVWAVLEVRSSTRSCASSIQIEGAERVARAIRLSQPVLSDLVYRATRPGGDP